MPKLLNSFSSNCMLLVWQGMGGIRGVGWFDSIYLLAHCMSLAGIYYKQGMFSSEGSLGWFGCLWEFGIIVLCLPTQPPQKNGYLIGSGSLRIHRLVVVAMIALPR